MTRDATSDAAAKSVAADASDARPAPRGPARGRARRRGRALPLVALVVALAACGPDDAGAPAAAATPEDDLAVVLRAEVDEAPLGRAFPVAVVRTYSRDYVPEPFRPEALRPLVFVPESTARFDAPGFVRETIRGRGYLFTLDDVADLRATFTALPRRGGLARTVSSAPIAVRTTPALRPDDPLDAEFPGEPFAPVRRSAVAALALGGVGLACGGGLFFARRRAARRAAGAAGRARVAAHERLARLRDAAETPAEWERFHVELSDALREHWEDRHAVPAPHMTTEEWARSPDAAAACGERHAAAVALLAACDGVKFARAAPAPDAARERLEAAERLVAERRP